VFLFRSRFSVVIFKGLLYYELTITGYGRMSANAIRYIYVCYMKPVIGICIGNIASGLTVNQTVHTTVMNVAKRLSEHLLCRNNEAFHCSAV
jgi:hypothetical protein